MMKQVRRLWVMLAYGAPLLRDTLVFICSWSLLSAVLNVRYPADDPAFWFLIPSLDVTALLLIVALLAAFRLKLPKAAYVGLAGFFILLRLFRTGDGITQRFQGRNVDPFVDLPLVPELARLLYYTVPFEKLAGIVLGILVSIPLSIFVIYKAFRFSERYLFYRKRALVFASIVWGLVIASAYRPEVVHPERYAGAFAASMVPRLSENVQAFADFRTFKSRMNQRLQTATRLLDETSADLAKLEGNNVLMITVESYGETVLSDRYRALMEPAYQKFEAVLKEQGFYSATSVLDSSVVGGYSWLTHASIGAFVRAETQEEFEFVRAAQSRTIVDIFRNAGYRTIGVQPATMRPPKPPFLLDFDVQYYSWDFGYKGRSFSWAPMADQFILDFINRRELQRFPKNQFVWYFLVCSHAPWNIQPIVVKDWSTIGDGSIYRKLPTRRFPTSWTNMSRAGPAYMRSIQYDFDVLGRYIEEFVKDDSLLIIWGDHQPVAEVTGNPKARGVPFHIVSRKRALVEPFIRRGYVPGMRPRAVRPYAGIETFFPNFVRDFSNSATVAKH